MTRIWTWPAPVASALMAGQASAADTYLYPDAFEAMKKAPDYNESVIER